MSGTQYPALTVGQGVPAPANILQLAQTAQGFQANQLALQQQRAKIAVGQAYQAATDPTTGQVDQGKFRALVAASPDAAADAQAAGGTSLDQAGISTGNDTRALSLQQQKLAFLAGLAAPLAANPNTTKQDVANQMQHAVNFAHIDTPTAQAALDTIPGDQAGVHAALGNFLKANMAPSEEYGHIYGTTPIVNAGGTLQSGTQAPADQGGGFTASGSTPITQTQSELKQPRAIHYNPDGSVVMGTQEQYQNEAANAQSGQFGNGRYNPQAQSALTQPSPGSVDSARTSDIAGATALAEAQKRASTFSTRMYQGQTALAALQQLGPTGTGPGTEGRNALVSYAQSAGFIAPSDSTKAYDEANKYLTAAAMQQPGADSSDSRLATSLSANASTHISNLAAQDVVKANIALDRQTQAATLAFNQSGLPSSQFQKFATNWSSTVDPRVYAFDLMSPAQRTTLMGTLTKGQSADQSTATKAKFYGQVQQAVGLGLVKPPGQGGQQPQQQAPQVPTGG